MKHLACASLIFLLISANAKAADVELAGKEAISFDLGQLALGYGFKNSTSTTKKAVKSLFRHANSISIPDKAKIVSDKNLEDGSHVRVIDFTIDGQRVSGDIADCPSKLKIRKTTTCATEACTWTYAAVFSMAKRGDTITDCYQH